MVAPGCGPRHRGDCARATNGNYVEEAGGASIESDEVVAEGVRRRIRSAARIDLVVDVGNVSLNGVHTQTQPGSDLLVGVASCDVSQHLHFARSEPIVPHWSRSWSLG